MIARRISLAVAVVSLVGMSADRAAASDAFYVCKKRGEAPAWVNEPMVASKKKNGYSCQKRIAFGGGTAPSASTGAAPSPGGGGPSDAAPRWSGARFNGPAGERESFEVHIQEAAKRYNVPANLVRAVIKVESNFRPEAVSSAGAKGLMQLMPGTAKEMAVTDLFDARQNILGGTRYLRLLINRFEGDIRLVIAAYHAGPAAVAAKGGIPYEATERYVRAVIKNYLVYKDTQL
ncbi:MAG: lytic transglycosylase domain-containing protein [Myxococcales bacterium]|nr:lytic transglycosylase domain-containing protein [Myxococcales bacterium]